MSPRDPTVWPVPEWRASTVQWLRDYPTLDGIMPAIDAIVGTFPWMKASIGSDCGIENGHWVAVPCPFVMFKIAPNPQKKDDFHVLWFSETFPNHRGGADFRRGDVVDAVGAVSEAVGTFLKCPEANWPTFRVVTLWYSLSSLKLDRKTRVKLSPTSKAWTAEWDASDPKWLFECDRDHRRADEESECARILTSSIDHRTSRQSVHDHVRGLFASQDRLDEEA